MRPMSEPTTPSANDERRVKLGWRMVGVAFFVDFVAVGFFFYSYGVFYKAIAEEFGGDRFGVALGMTAAHTVGALAAPLVGRALDAFPLRNVIGLGAVSMSVGFLLLSRVSAEWQFLLVLGVFIGFGANSMGTLSTGKLITNWFNRRRSTALGIAATGVSVSGVIMPYVSAELIEAYGWRQGFLAYGLFTAFIVLPLVLRLVVTRPEDVGLSFHAAGSTPPEIEQTQSTATLLTTPNFWAIALTFGLLFACMSMTMTHMVPRLTDAGYTLTTASLMVSLAAGLGVVGKLGAGWLGDVMALRRLLWLVIGLQLAGQAVMFTAETFISFAVGTAVFGLAAGGMVPLQAALVGESFGARSFGSALGLMRPAMFPIQILGVPFAGLVFDRTGSYDLAFQAALIAYTLAIGVAWFYRSESGR